MRSSIRARSSCSWRASRAMNASRERRVRAHRLHHDLLRIDPNARWRGGDGIAVIGIGKKGGFGEELAPAGGMKDHQMVIDGAADQAKSTTFDLVDRRRLITLTEQ